MRASDTLNFQDNMRQTKFAGKSPQGLPKEQNSQASGFPDEDCKWMWLWRRPPRKKGGAAEGATRAGRRTRANLSGKRTELEGRTAIRTRRRRAAAPRAGRFPTQRVFPGTLRMTMTMLFQGHAAHAVWLFCLPQKKRARPCGGLPEKRGM